jgi:hypothetical protein
MAPHEKGMEARKKDKRMVNTGYLKPDRKQYREDPASCIAQKWKGERPSTEIQRVKLVQVVKTITMRRSMRGLKPAPIYAFEARERKPLTILQASVRPGGPARRECQGVFCFFGARHVLYKIVIQ